MPDVFDSVAAGPAKDVFDQLSAPAADVFDRIAAPRLTPGQALQPLAPERMTAQQAEAFASDLAERGHPEAARAYLQRQVESHGGAYLPSEGAVLSRKIAGASLTPEEMGAFLPGWAAKPASALETGAVEGLGGLASPENILYLPAAPVMAPAFLAQMGIQGAADIGRAGLQAVRGEGQEALRSLARGLVTAAPLGLAAARTRPATPPSAEAPVEFSEFGGEPLSRTEPAPLAVAAPAGTAPETPPAEPAGVTKLSLKAGAEPPATPTPHPEPTPGEPNAPSPRNQQPGLPPQPQGGTEGGQTAEAGPGDRLRGSAPGEVAAQAPAPAPIAEAPDTLAAQLEWLRAGKRQAVLFSPGETVPPWALQREGWGTVETPEGTVVFDRAATTGDQIAQAVAAGQTGRVLGYGLEARPDPGSEVGVVVVRSPNGLEKQAVATDAAHLPDVLRAAQAVADPGDQVRLEKAGDVLAGRLQARQTAPPAETWQARDAREQREASAAMAVSKAAQGSAALQAAAEPPPAEAGAPTTGIPKPVPVTVTPAHEKAAAQAAPERAPDLLDWLESNHPKIRITSPEDFGVAARDLPSRARALIGAAGEPADVVAEMAARAGFGRIGGEADLLAAMRDAARARAGQRGAAVAERRALAEEIARNEAWRKTQTPDDRGHKTQRESVPVNQLFVGDRFTVGGREQTVTGWQQDAETGRPTGVVTEGAWGRQFLGVNDQVRVDKGSLAFVDQGALREEAPAGGGAGGNEPLRSDSRDAVERTLDRWIQKTASEPGQMLEGVTGAPVWLTRAAINGALRAAKFTYTTTRDLAQALAAGVEHLRSLKLPGFNADEAASWLKDNFRERATGQKILASPFLDDRTKQGIAEYLYQRLPMVDATTAAQELVRKLGVDAAEEMVRTRPEELPGAVQSKLLGETLGALADQARAARQAGDTAGYDQLTQRQSRLFNDVLPRITDDAQRLAAYADVVRMSPDAQVERVRQDVEADTRKVLQRQQGQLEVLRTALEQGRVDGTEATRTDRAVNEAARTAVNEQIAGSRETQRAVIMDLAEPWAQSPTVLAHAREQVRSKVDELLNRAPRPPGLTAAQHFRQIADDLAARAASIFAGHVQGAEPGKGIVDKLQERLGLERERARALATALSKEWDRQVDLAKKEIPKKLAEQRARQRSAGIVAAAAPDTALDQSIRKQLSEWNQKLGESFTAAAADRNVTGQKLAEGIVARSGLTGDAAETLRARIKTRFETLVKDGQHRALEAMQARLEPKDQVKPPLKRAFEKLVELDRLGAFDDDKFTDVIKQSLKLKRLTAEDAAAIRRLAERAQEMPAGFLRERAAGELMKVVGKLRGEARPVDVAMGMFYANVLSGLTTYAKIPLENLNLYVGGTLTHWLARPAEWLHPLNAARTTVNSLKAGLLKGGLQAQDTLRHGIITGVWERPKPPGAMEMQPFGARWEPLNFWKWFTRGIGVMHETTFKPAWEFKQTLLARDVARREGLRGAALQQRVADLMADTPAQVAEARAQAVQELTARGLYRGGKWTEAADLARRTREIIEQRREVNMPGSTAASRDYALRTAYLNKPYGVLGALASGVRATIDAARREAPAIGSGIKAQIPFTQVIANILNEKLNWSPVGLLRAGLSLKTGKLYGREILSADERAEAFTKAVVGTVALGALAELATIHGNGPSDPKKRRQLQESGWIPHSIQIGGRYVSYMNTPAGVGLAILGNLQDWSRYGKGEEADAYTRAGFATKATLNAIVSQGMLDSVKRIFEALGEESTSEGAEKLERAFARTAGSFVVPNLVSQTDRLFDPTVYDKPDVHALLLSQVPFVRRENRPVLNVLGEPVEASPFHYWQSHEKPDPVWQLIAAQQAWIPEPSRSLIVGNKRLGPDYYRAITPDEYYELIAESGPRIREDLERDYDKIAGMEPAQAQAYVRRIAELRHAQARARLTP